MPVVIHGSSDDLIEVDGDIQEEFSAYDSEAEHFVVASDGTMLRIEYGRSGVWRITVVFAGSAELHIEQAPEGDDDNYTDRATLTGDIRWVAHATEYAKAKG